MRTKMNKYKIPSSSEEEERSRPKQQRHAAELHGGFRGEASFICPGALISDF